MPDFEEDWASLRRGAPTPPSPVADPNLQDDWRELQGIPEFGYVLMGVFWGELAVWKVRILGRSTCPRNRPHAGFRIERVELLWHQPLAKTDKTYEFKGRRISVFRTHKDRVDFTLMDVSCRLLSHRDKARTEYIYHQKQLQETIRKSQEALEEATKKLAELSAFSPDAVLPADLLEAEELELEQALSELT